MNHFNKKPVAIAVAATVAGMMAVGTAQAVKYEVWASDQSNTGAAPAALGKTGSLLWIWDSEGSTGVKAFAADSGPSPTQPAVLNCNGATGPGPCDIHDIFPDTLDEYDNTTGGAAFDATGSTLADRGPIARLHGAIPDPQNLYVNMNMFGGQFTTGSGTGNGFIGIMDGDAKEAIALWRVSQTTGTSGGGRSLHMSFWNSTGSALLLANLHGRILERIDIVRDDAGAITGADFNQAASVGMGGNTGPIADSAKAYRGLNGAGNSMIGTTSGTYAAEATSLTFGAGTGVGESNGLTCKQKDCGVAGADTAAGRPGNVIVCPIVSSNNLVYVTFGGGGLLVADATTDPMEIVGAYDNSVVNGAGCGGVEVGGFVYLNAGTSAASGADKSTSSMFKISTKGFGPGFITNLPTPVNTFQDGGNTGTLGAPSGGFIPATNGTGQLPGTTTRSDAHGMTPTITGNYVHMDDRIQNEMIVFDSNDFTVSTYSLTGGGCLTESVTDGGLMPIDDPAPDLMATGPENKYLFAALRGPNPVTVSFNAQGSCPGVGIIALDAATNGQSGTMTHVLRTTNAVASPRSAPSGGFDYLGAEFSDPHGVSLRIR